MSMEIDGADSTKPAGSSESANAFDVAGLLNKFNNGTAIYGDVIKNFRSAVPTFLRLTPNSFTFDSASRDDFFHHAVKKYLLQPLEDFIVDYKYTDLQHYLTSIDNAPPVCGRLFKIGEPTYHCRQCATDSTCVLCVECFTNSKHRFHKYKMRTSGGGGCCDCGDEEAWSESAFCDIHKVRVDPEEDLPSDMLQRAKFIFDAVLRYSSSLLTSANLTLPAYLQPDVEASGNLNFSPLSNHYCTVLYNDEVHTFDQVINTLMRVMKCTQRDAVECVTNIDREGRAIVKCGSFKVCCELKSDLEKHTSRHGGKVVKVVVVQARMVAHQTFALKLISWLQNLLKPSMKLRQIFAEVATSPVADELHFDDSPESPVVTYLESVFIHDTFLWKSARLQFHRLFITGMLMDYPNKKEFANLFVKRYRTIMNYFVEDDHEHSFSVASLSVQIFTVRSLALYLMEENDIFFKIMYTFLQECNARRNHGGKLEFDRHTPNVKFKRAVYSLYDIKYILSFLPDEINEAVGTSFLNGYREVTSLLATMQGMDAVTRQVGQHMEYEPEWESAFNLHIKLAPIIKLILKWSSSDRMMFVHACRSLALKMFHEVDTFHNIVYDTVTVGNFTERVIMYDVSSRPVSIHLPLSRLFAGLSVYFDKFSIDCCGFLTLRAFPEIPEDGNYTTWDFLLLIEFVLRTRVMIAQVHAGMWRRNGYSLSNQIYFYNNVKCRGEMLDRDIILLQLGASLLSPHSFLMSVLSKFNLVNWADPDFEKTNVMNTEEDSIRQIAQLLEEFLLLLITIISERYVPGVGQVTEADCLKREIIQQLCIQPLSHSELEKTLPEDIIQESGMENLIDDVAEFKRPGKGSSKGVYELKPKFADTYNVFFYHYTREELSKSEECQRKYNKTAIGLECCPPPKLPPFTKPFYKVTDLLTCDLMIYIMKTILERCLNLFARSFSEPQVHKVLHLIGTALHDEECGHLSQSFIAKASDPEVDIPGLLEKLLNNPRVDAHKDLIKWTIRKFFSLSKKENVQTFQMENSEAENNVKECRSRLAAERKAKVMAQLAAAQKNFMKDNAHLFDEPMPVTEASEEYNVSLPQNPYVCLGVEQIVDQSPPLSHTCILCQEQQDVTADGRALVYAAFVQRSTVLSKNRVMHTIKTEDVYNMFLSPNIGPGLHTSTCGHVMHRACWQGWYDNVINKESRRPYRLRQPSSFDVDKQEYLCPLCECLSNTVIPVLPKLSKLHNLRELPLKKATVETWKDLMLAAIRKSKKQKDLGYVLCQDESPKDSENEIINKSSSADLESGSAVKVIESSPTNSNPFRVHERSRVPESAESTDEEMAPLDPDVGGSSANTQNLADLILSPMVPKDVFMDDSANTSKEKSEDEDVPSLLSNDINSMMLHYAQSTYLKRFSVFPHEEYPLVPLIAWQSCAYTIHALEQYLRINSKPLFGDLSSRQTHTLEALVRLSGALGAAWKDGLVINHQASQLLEMVLDNSDELPGILDWDSFGMLVALICSHNSMYNSGLPTVPTGTKLDLFVFQTMFYSMIIQILSAMDPMDAVPIKYEGKDSMPVSAELSCLLQYTTVLHGNTNIDAEYVWNHIKVEALPFLRCSALFFCFLTDVMPPEELNRVGGDTFENLCSYLGVPSTCDELLGNRIFSSYLGTWTSKLVSVWPSLRGKQRMFSNMSHTNSLIPLPEDYSDLINKVSLFTCPKSDREDSRYPTMCLVCGDMLCSQTYCCQTELKKNLVGACNFHAFKCGAGIGTFLRIRDCEILLLATPNRGCFATPPYLDEYGEADPGLNRGNPLKLCPERYKKLQTSWLTHSIYEEIARSIESSKSPLNVQWQHL